MTKTERQIKVSACDSDLKYDIYLLIPNERSAIINFGRGKGHVGFIIGKNSKRNYIGR
ncbi:hypothetical protein TPENAI_60749 [Tenacibaculum litopenaei]